MKKFQCYKDFKTSMKQENIPNIDEELMINKIYSNLHSEPKYNKLRVASIVFSFILLTTGSIAIAKNLNVNLFNDKGEKVFEVGKTSNQVMKEDQEVSKIISNYTSVIENARKNTKVGEQSTVLIAKAYEIGGFRHPFQNNKYKTIEELKRATLNKFKVPILPTGLYVSDISVYFKEEIDEDFINNYEIIDKETNLPLEYPSKSSEYSREYLDNLYKECIDTNKDYIVGTQKLTNDIKWVQSYINFDDSYSPKHNNSDRILFKISKEIGSFSSDFNENNVEKIKIGDKEAILQRDIYNNSSSYTITYVDSCNNENFTYTLSGFLKSEKELVIEILKSLQ